MDTEKIIMHYSNDRYEKKQQERDRIMLIALLNDLQEFIKDRNTDWQEDVEEVQNTIDIINKHL